MACVAGDVLTSEERAVFDVLHAAQYKNRQKMELLDRYYEGEQRLRQLGIALPMEFQDFSVVVNVPRMAVDEPVRRQHLKAFQRSGMVGADPALREMWEANNLDSQSGLVHKDARLYGRTFVSVDASGADGDLPKITAEDPAGFDVFVNPRTRMIDCACRRVSDPAFGQYWTLFFPDQTVYVEAAPGGWRVLDRRVHNLGRVPVVGFLNRPRAGRFDGTSEMKDVIGLTDSIARFVTNAQVAGETHATPARWAAGLKRTDFVDADGVPLPAWEAYFTSIMSTENAQARFGQFTAADMSNFTNTVNSMLAWCAAVLGLPVRFMGQQTANPASEGAIRADEARLITTVEAMNRADGDSWVWTMGLAERFRTGEWPDRNSIRALWENPATPTMSERADAITKYYAQGLLSREGTWDEMGWDEARKDRERAYFQQEASDPVIERIMRDVGSGSTRVGTGAVADAGADRGGGAAGDAGGAGDFTG